MINSNLDSARLTHLLRHVRIRLGRVNRPPSSVPYSMYSTFVWLQYLKTLDIVCDWQVALYGWICLNTRHMSWSFVQEESPSSLIRYLEW